MVTGHAVCHETLKSYVCYGITEQKTSRLERVKKLVVANCAVVCRLRA
jgi:hypothetical protein